MWKSAGFAGSQRGGAPCRLNFYGDLRARTSIDLGHSRALPPRTGAKPKFSERIYNAIRYRFRQLFGDNDAALRWIGKPVQTTLSKIATKKRASDTRPSIDKLLLRYELNIAYNATRDRYHEPRKRIEIPR